MPDKEFPRTPSLRFFHRYRNLVIETKFDGAIKIEKADLPELIAAAMAIAIEEDIPAEDVRRACENAGVSLDKL